MRISVLLGIVLCLSGCSMKMLALRSTVSLLDQGKRAFYSESDTILAREAMGSQLKLLEALLENDPDNRKLLLLLAESFSGYAFLFLDDSEPDRAKVFYQRGRNYALKRLSRGRPAWKGELNSSAIETAAQALKAADMPALFWAAHAWGGWINLSRDDMDAVADLPIVAVMMEEVRRRSPGFNFAGPHLFFGAYYASRPRMLGGDPKKSRAHFDEARRINKGKFLMAKVLEARYYAVATQDEELYKKLLTEVAEAPAGALPDSRLIDEVAKKKAKALMERTDEFF